MSYKSKFTGEEVDKYLQKAKDIEVDASFDINSQNPIANAPVAIEFSKVWRKIDSSQVVTFDSLIDAEMLKEVFNYWHLEKFLNQPISCYIKTEGNEERYEIATLVVEKYDEDYKLNFIRFDATSQFRMYDENGEDMGHYNPEWQWSPRCRLINGICDSYLIQDNGYVMHLGKGEVVIADDKLDASSDRPISNKAVAKTLNDVAEDAKVLMLPDDNNTLPVKGVEGKIYYIYDGDLEHLHPYVWWSDKWIPMTHDSVCVVYYGEGYPSFSKVLDAFEKHQPCICIDNRDINSLHVYYLLQYRLNDSTRLPEFVFSSPNSQKNLILKDNGTWSGEKSDFGTLYNSVFGGCVTVSNDVSSLANAHTKLVIGGKLNASINKDNTIVPCSCNVSRDEVIILKYLTRTKYDIVEHTYELFSTGELRHTSEYIGRKEKEISVTTDTIDVQPNEYIRLKKADSVNYLHIKLKSDETPLYKEYIIEYNGGDFNILWPENIRWANRQQPTQNKGSVYQVRIVNNLGSFVEYLRSEISFTIGNQDVLGEQGMTWEEWVGSSYNSIGATILDTMIIVDDQVVVLESEVKSTDLIISNAMYELQAAMSHEEVLVGTYNHSATSTGGATLGTAHLPTIARDSSGNFTMSSLLGNSSSGPVANATYDDTAKTFTVLKGWTHPMFGPVDVDIVFDVDFNSMTLTAKSDFTVGGWATISGYKLVKKS